jgi:hypothetical protein
MIVNDYLSLRFIDIFIYFLFIKNKDFFVEIITMKLNLDKK